MPETVPFILLTTQRTGSSWLTTLLDNHPRADAYGELFLAGEGSRPPWGARNVERFWSFRSSKRGRGLRRPRLTVAYLDDLFGSNPTAGAVGFKLMYDQAARYPEIFAYSLRKEVRVIHLVRPNLLDVLISRQLMVVRGKPHATAADEVQPASVELDPGTLRRRLRALELQISFFRRSLRVLRLRRLEVAYDTLVTDPSTLPRVLSFLDLPVEVSLTSPLVRINDKKQSELVENYAAIAGVLEGTRFSSFLSG